MVASFDGFEVSLFFTLRDPQHKLNGCVSCIKKGAPIQPREKRQGSDLYMALSAEFEQGELSD